MTDSAHSAPRDHWLCPGCGTFDGPISYRRCDACEERPEVRAMGYVGGGTPHARMEATWDRMAAHDREVARLTTWTPISSTMTLEWAFVDAFAALRTENEALRLDMAKVVIKVADRDVEIRRLRRAMHIAHDLLSPGMRAGTAEAKDALGNALLRGMTESAFTTPVASDEQRPAPLETTQDLRTHVGGGLFVKPLGHIPPSDPTVCTACGGDGTLPPVDLTDPDYRCERCDGTGRAPGSHPTPEEDR